MPQNRPYVSGQTSQRTTTTPGRAPKPRDPRRSKLAQFLMRQTGSSRVDLPDKFRAPPVDPLDEQVEAQTRLRYGGAQAELQRTGQAIPEWFKAYQAQLAEATEADRAAQREANAQLAGLQTSMTNLGTSQAQALGASEGASAATRGAAVDPTMMGRAADAGGVRRDLLGSFQAQMVQQGLTQEGRNSERGKFAGAQQLRALEQNAQKRQDLASERGQFKVEARRQMLEELRKAALEEAIFGQNAASDEAKLNLQREGMGQDAAEAAARLREQRAGRQQQARENQAGRDVTMRGQDMSSADRRAALAEKRRKEREKEREKEGGPDWAKPKDQAKAGDSIDRALHYAKMLKKNGLKRHDAASYLLEGKKASKDDPRAIPAIESLYASIALDLAYDGHISRRNIQRLHDRKIQVKPLGHRTKPKVKRPIGGSALNSALDAVNEALG